MDIWKAKVEGMKDFTEKFGRNAGKIWTTLNTHGPCNKPTLIKNTRMSEADFYAAIGWLARENKVCKEGNYYKLGETNLTSKIGEDAGKIWKVLGSQGETDMLSISKTTQIKIPEAYSALGWLAREDKVLGKKSKSNANQIKVKLK